MTAFFFPPPSGRTRRRANEKDRPLPPLLARVNGQIEVRCSCWVYRAASCFDMCWNSSSGHISFAQFLAWRHFVWVFSVMLRLFVTCSLTLIFQSGLTPCCIEREKILGSMHWFLFLMRDGSRLAMFRLLLNFVFCMTNRSGLSSDVLLTSFCLMIGRDSLAESGILHRVWLVKHASALKLIYLSAWGVGQLPVELGVDV